MRQSSPPSPGPEPMRTLTVTRTIAARPEAVFELISDHAGYKRFRGIPAPSCERAARR
jgi:uncharacterized protein YndB with AHSA1/START domain